MKKVLFVLMCVCMVSLAQADLIITNGTFDGGNAGDTDVPDWYDLDNPDRGAAWWQTASICAGPNPFPDDACMMGDAFPSGDADSYIYQAIGTKASCQSYSISIDYSQPTDGSEARSPWLQVDIFQGSFPGAADDVNIANQGLTLIDSVSSESFPDMDIHNFTSPLDLSLANATDMLWIRIANLPGLGSDAGSWVVIDNVQLTSEPAPCGEAYNPNPANNSTDILHDTVLSWTPGEFANTHNLFLGTDFDDVNNATIAAPLSTIVIEGQDANNYDPDHLEFDQTYYWRIDEVNAPPDSYIYKGEVWSFKVEPIAYPIPSESITATASSQEGNQGPEKTIDGSGLDVNDLHSVEPDTMWSSTGGEPGSAWIQYEFDKSYKLHEMLVWNYNGNTILSLYGLKEVLVEYSTDSASWTQLVVPEFAQATGLDGYASDIAVAFDGAVATYVKITANSNHGGGEGFFNKYGLSEVRFTAIPVNAKRPNPDIGATDVAVDATLSWRPGREAVEHNVLLSTDEQAVIDGTAEAVTVGLPEHSPSLALGSTYYWRIDEVNNAESPSIWESDIWNFSTQEYIVVDDFESYNDILEGQEGSNLVYMVWEDGYANPATNGSTIGYVTGTSMETGNVYAGGQAAPLLYNNTGASSSEVSIDPGKLPIGRNWSVGSPAALVVWVFGDPGNTGNDQLYVKVGNSKFPYDGDITRPQWKPVVVDLTGVNLNNVSSVVVGIERSGGAGGSGIVFIDEIRLYGTAPAGPAEEIWIEAESADSIQAPMMTFNDPNASGGKYIMKDPDAGASTGSPPADGLVTYQFTVAGGTYTIAGRVITSGSNDSFWVRIPDATMNVEGDPSNPGWIEWNGMTQEDVWGWEDVFSSNNNNVTVEFTLPAGTYTMEIRYRESESQLDALVITSID